MIDKVARQKIALLIRIEKIVKIEENIQKKNLENRKSMKKLCARSAKNRAVTIVIATVEMLKKQKVLKLTKKVQFARRRQSGWKIRQKWTKIEKNPKVQKFENENAKQIPIQRMLIIRLVCHPFKCFKKAISVTFLTYFCSFGWRNFE